MSSEESFNSIGKIEAISRLYTETSYSHADCVSFTPANGSKVKSSSKMYLEGMDFDLTYFPLQHLGHKCVTGVTGELLSAMAHPRILDVKLGVSAKLDYSHIKDIWKGITTAAREYGYSDVALDLTPSRNGLSICLSAVGEITLITEKRKPSPKSKDLICISGSLGAAYLGMSVLEREKRSFNTTNDDSTQPDLTKYRMLIGSYLKPELNASVVDQMEDAEIYPSTGYFVTRGLSDAVKKLVRDSGLGAKIYADKIPFEGNSFSIGKELDIDPISAAMNGGDDYRLLFTIPILYLDKFRKDFQTFDIIGHLAQEEVGSVLVTPDGVELPLKAQGWANEE
ncbi:MAG: AIR synthase related protein [Bacteroidales bacterium]|nr:AIR synthase related protein [Bacteroidales bacterium]